MSWYFNEYVFQGSLEDARALYKSLKNGSLIDEDETLNSIGELNLSGDSVEINAEGRLLRFRDLEEAVRNEFPNMKMFFYCESDDQDICVKHDPEGKRFPENFILDIYANDIYNFQEEFEVIKKLEETYQVKLKDRADVEMFIEKHNDEIGIGNDGYISLIEVESV